MDEKTKELVRVLDEKTKDWDEKGADGHFHRDEHGFLVKCYHRCRVLWSGPFWLGVTLSYPLEHFLWEKIPPFSFIGTWLGL